jgi:LuxR family maltose regulon positive regulatory protein
VIDRPRFWDRLLAGEPKRLTLITAPPGYGKTTLAIQWANRLARSGFSVAWLAVDSDDDDPVTLLTYIVAALEGAKIDLGQLKGMLRQGQYGLAAKPTLHALVRVLERHPSPVLLVLEDVDRLRDDKTLTILNSLIDRLPPHVNLCLTGRARPALRLAALKMQGLMNALDANDLRFTLNETTTYLGPGRSTEIVARLQEQSEGWPVALQLARVHLESGADAPSAGRFIGRTSELAEYLAEQVLETLPDDLRDVLLTISILDRFTAPLINRLSGRTDGGLLLEQLRSTNLFLTPIDPEQDWYRFHPLFAEFLRGRLERADLQRPGMLHRLSAEWFLEKGLVQDAVRHAQLGGDVALICRILEEAGGWRVFLRSGPTLLNIFRGLDWAIVAASPRLRIGKIFLMIQDGRVAEAERAFEQMLRDGGGLESPALKLVRGDILFVDLLLRAHSSAPMRPEQAAMLEQRMAEIEPNDPVTEVIVAEMTAMAQYWAGDFDRACDLAKAGSRACQRNGLPFVETYCHAVAGLARFERGDTKGATACFERALALSIRLCGPDSDRVFVPRLFLAEIWLEQGNAEAASDLLVRGIEAIEEGESWSDLFRIAYGMAIATAADSDVPLLLRRAERLSSRSGLNQLFGFATAAALRRAAACADFSVADRLYQNLSLRERLESESQDWQTEAELFLAGVDYAILKEDWRPAAGLLARVEASALARGHNRALIRIRGQRAVLRQAAGDEAGAIHALDAALALARPGGIVRPFSDHGRRLRPLLIRIAQTACVEPGDEIFRGRLMQATTTSPDTDPSEPESPDQLSPRERAVLNLIAEGQTSKEAARRLGISVNTVMTHRKNLYRKLDATTRSRAIATARAIGLIL